MNPTLREWLYAREVLRRLGFTADELFCVVYPSGRLVESTGDVHDLGVPIVGLEVRRGGLTFKWTIGAIDMPAADVQVAFDAACEDWNAGRVFDKESFLKSNAVAQSIPLMIALRRKGFSFTEMHTN